MSWADSMAALNGALLEIFPDSIWFNGAQISCIAPPLDVFKTIKPGPYDAKVTFTFQILETDRATAGMKLKDSIEFETPYAKIFDENSQATRLTFQIANFRPDDNDSIVQVICNLKQ